MTQEEIQNLISHQAMFLVIAKAQRESDGSRVYDEKMVQFAIDALNHLSEEVDLAFKEKQ